MCYADYNGVRPLIECPGYDIRQYDGETPVLEQ